MDYSIRFPTPSPHACAREKGTRKRPLLSLKPRDRGSSCGDGASCCWYLAGRTPAKPPPRPFVGRIHGEPHRAAGADVAPPGRHRPPQGVQRVRLRQHDGDQHPRPPRRDAARAHPAGVPGLLQPGPVPANRVRAQQPPQAGDAAVDPRPRRPRRHDPEAGSHRRHHRPARRHRGRLLPDAVPAADRAAGLPRQVRLLRRARHHRAHLRRPPEAPAGVPGDPTVRGPGGGPVDGDARRAGALQGRRAAAGHRRADVHPHLQRAQLGAHGVRRPRLPPHVRPLPREGRQERDVGQLRVRPAHHPPLRREPSEILCKGAAQGDEGAGHERLGADPGGGHEGGNRHAVHQGGVPQDVQAVARRRHPLRDIRELPHLPPLPRRTRPLATGAAAAAANRSMRPCPAFHLCVVSTLCSSSFLASFQLPVQAQKPLLRQRGDPACCYCCVFLRLGVGAVASTEMRGKRSSFCVL